MSCIKTNRVFACQNILIITKADVEDAGKYRCILSDNNSTYYTVAVIGIDIYLYTVNVEFRLTNTCSYSSCIYAYPRRRNGQSV